MKTLLFTPYFFVLYFVFSFVTLNAQQKSKVSSETNNGLSTVTFDTPSGRVTTYFPSTMHAGDVISGTVVAEPEGKNEKQIAKNKNVISGYVIELEGTESDIDNEKMTWKLPGIISSGIAYLVLKDAKGKELGKSPIPLNSVPREILPTNVIDFSEFSIPDYLRSGETEMINGPFDGDFGNSSIKVNGTEAPVLAESPEAIFFAVPDNLKGEVEIELVENGYYVGDKACLVDLYLSADKLTLAKGESSTVNIEVSGLEGIETEVPLSITNITPSSIQMEGGLKREIKIGPNDVDESGVYKTTADVTATRAGGFSVMVEIAPPQTAIIKPIYPTNGEVVVMKNIEFRWATYGMPLNTVYTLKVYQLDENTSPNDIALGLNNLEPIAIAKNLATNSHSFTETFADGPDENDVFAWKVEAYDEISGKLLGEKEPGVFYTASVKKCRCKDEFRGKIFARVSSGNVIVADQVQFVDKVSPTVVRLPAGPLTITFTGSELFCGDCQKTECQVSNVVYNPAQLVINPTRAIQTAEVTVTWDCISDDCVLASCTNTFKFRYRLAPDDCLCGDVGATVTVRNMNGRYSNTSSTITRNDFVGGDESNTLIMGGNLKFDNNDKLEITISDIIAKCWCENGICDVQPAESGDRGTNVSIDLGENDDDASSDNHNLVRTESSEDGWQTNGDYVIEVQIRNANSNISAIYQDFTIKYKCSSDDCSGEYCSKKFRVHIGNF